MAIPWPIQVRSLKALTLIIMAMQNDESSRSSYKYDVFLSYCRKDTRRTFTGTLYHALRQKKIKTFFCEKNNDGWENPLQLSPSILKAIHESRISILVLSENYPSSTLNLDELVNILHCMKINNHLVCPVFYKVDPLQVKKQTGPYEKHMVSLEAMFQERESERLLQWRGALTQAGILAGWSILNETEYEYHFVQRIVESIIEQLPRYDIFLSFCGEDTRYSFTGFLYHALRREGFNTFMDDDGLKGGNHISDTLLEAIDKSRLSIVVFSENYGYSTWCLDELVKIMQCNKTKNQLVWPIFYKIDQEQVSNQTGHYGKAMTAYENQYGKDSKKVQDWRLALSQVAFLEGEHVKENEYESEVIKKIVEKAIDVENNL